jgi:hypothetical protein
MNIVLKVVHIEMYMFKKYYFTHPQVFCIKSFARGDKT